MRRLIAAIMIVASAAFVVATSQRRIGVGPRGRGGLRRPDQRTPRQPGRRHAAGALRADREGAGLGRAHGRDRTASATRT